MGFILRRYSRGFRFSKKSQTGFTLVELLVVVGILSVLLAIVLIAINPFEQLNKTSDIANQVVIKDFASATKYFYTEEKTTPWVKNSTCRNELANQDTISQMPTCVEELTKGGDLQTEAVNSNEAKEIFMTECSNSVALCYKPKSSAYKNNSNAKYQRNGALNPNCPNDENCYICDFSTNNAQECFEIMSPNTEELAIAASESPNDIQLVPNRPSKDVCEKPVDDGKASCASKVVTDSNGNPLTTLALPKGLSPEQLHKAYSLPCTPGGSLDWECDTPATFGPRIIAIIVAFHTPQLESDLAVFTDKYNLPPCTKANGCLTVVNQDGNTSPVPSTSTIWSSEANLDVQMAHAICQTCKILVVETINNSFINLATGVSRAASMGATSISNSYGAYESAAHSPGLESSYDLPGVFVVAATGDWGYGPITPSSFTNVIGAGGTTLYTRNDNTYASEIVWSGTGGGCSTLFNANQYQLNLPSWSSMGCGIKKSVADAAAVADPRTGVAIYDSSGYFGPPGWHISGGTSASSPILAAALTLQADTNSGVGASYIYSNSSLFRDVNVGSNGSCGGSPKCTAVAGYDGPTGLGSPNFLPQGGATPTEFPTPTPTPTPMPQTPTPTPRDILISSDPAYGYAVDTYHHLVTKVSRLGTSLGNICLEGEKLYCYGSFILSPSDKTSNYCQDYIGNSIPVYTRVGCSTDFTQIPWPTPTPAYPNCSQQHTISLKDNAPILATPGSKVTTTLLLKNNNTGNCNPIKYVTNVAFPGNTNPDTWSVTGNFNSFLLGTGETKELVYTINVPSVGLTNKDYSAKFSVAGYEPQEYTSWWVKSVGKLNSIVRVTGAPPTVTPTPNIPAECITQPTVTLSQPLTLGLPGTKIKSKMTIKSNASPTCDPVFYTVSYSIPTGWGLLQRGMYRALLPNVTDIIDYTLYLPSDGLLAQDYDYQFWISTSGQPSVDPVIVNGITRVSLPGSTISPTPTPTLNCTTQQTVTLTQSQPILALPGDSVNNTLTIKNNNTVGCGTLLYTISSSRPTGWTFSGIPASVSVTAGETKALNFTIQVPSNATADNYGYQFLVAKPGESSPIPVSGSVQVAQVGPTNTPTPTPINCSLTGLKSLDRSSVSAKAGDTFEVNLTVTNNNPAVCGNKMIATYYAYQNGWIIRNLPTSVQLAGGQSIVIPVSITISTGAEVKEYSALYVAGVLLLTVNVTATANPPTEQMFSNFRAVMYGNYAIFEYSYNVNGNLDSRLDVATEPSALNQTTGTNSLAKYNFGYSVGNAWDASNNASPNSVRGTVVRSPQSWSGWQCGSTIYYRMYNTGDLRVKSTIQSGVVDCVTQVNVLPLYPWQVSYGTGVYNSLYDIDHNGIVDHTDYWILVRATRMRI